MSYRTQEEILKSLAGMFEDLRKDKSAAGQEYLHSRKQVIVSYLISSEQYTLLEGVLDLLEFPREGLSLKQRIAMYRLTG